jgi:hypothetical protein
MTTERLTEQQIEEKAHNMQQSLCSNTAIKEQLRLLAILGRGGKIVLIYNKQGVLDYVSFENQLKVSSQNG